MLTANQERVKIKLHDKVLFMRSILLLVGFLAFAGCATTPRMPPMQGTVISVRASNAGIVSGAVVGGASGGFVAAASGAALLGPIGIASVAVGSAIIGLNNAITSGTHCGAGDAILSFTDFGGATQTTQQPNVIVCNLRPGDKFIYRGVDGKFDVFSKDQELINGNS